MADPTIKNLEDEGAQQQLHDQLEALEAGEPSYRFGSAPSSTRASSDGDPEERMHLMREEIPIFVDSGETEGLPSTSKKTDEEKNSNAAWSLVRSYTGGKSGLMRRKNTLFKAQGEAREKAKLDAEEGGTLGFFESKMRERSENLGGDPIAMGFSSTNAGGTGGVLSSLMALQQGAGQSGASTPGSIASSASYDEGSSSEDEEARMKFITTQREKRRRKHAWTPSAVVGAVYGGKHKSTLSLSNDPPSPAAVSIPQPKPLTASRSPMPPRSSMPAFDGSTDSPLPRSRPTSISQLPLDLPGTKRKSIFGESLHQVKKLGEKVGLDLDSVRTRPDAARNGGGVFGGLIASTVSRMSLTRNQLIESHILCLRRILLDQLHQLLRL